MSYQLMLFVGACAVLTGISSGAAAAQCTQSVTALNASREPVEVIVKCDPKRVAVLDMAVLDMLDSWNLGDRVVAMPKATVLPYLKKYEANPAIADVGTMKEVNLERLIASRPDVIFISARLARQYDLLKKIAPVVFLTTDFERGMLESVQSNAAAIARLFGQEQLLQERFESVARRIKAIAAQAQGQTAAVGMVTASHFNFLGTKARASLIGNEMGFTNVTQGQSPRDGKKKTAANDGVHGNEASFELLLKLNPDFIFVLDRDSAIGRPGARIARDVMDNPLVRQTKAYRSGRIIYLNAGAWYLAEGGLSALDLQVADIERAFHP